MSNCLVLSVKVKRLGKTSQIRIEKMNENEPLLKSRENEHSVKTYRLWELEEEYSGDLIIGYTADGTEKA